jgi:hypothetical protein
MTWPVPPAGPVVAVDVGESVGPGVGERLGVGLAAGMDVADVSWFVAGTVDDRVGRGVSLVVAVTRVAAGGAMATAGWASPDPLAARPTVTTATMKPTHKPLNLFLFMVTGDGLAGESTLPATAPGRPW